MKCPKECPVYQFSKLRDEFLTTIVAIQTERDVTRELNIHLKPSKNLRKAIELAVRMSQVIESGVLNFEKQLKNYYDELRKYIDYYKTTMVNEDE